MPPKPKTNQPQTADSVQERDCFETPDYGTDLIVPFLPVGAAIWEPAAGTGRMARRLAEHGFEVTATTLQDGQNFLDYRTGGMAPLFAFDAIITNPPYSLKAQFADRCLHWRKPWALLIPGDFSQWILRAIQGGCRLVVPERRIDYITPTGKSGKDSAAQFHSVWLTWGLCVPEVLHVVPLSNETKRGLPPKPAPRTLLDLVA